MRKPRSSRAHLLRSFSRYYLSVRFWPSPWVPGVREAFLRRCRQAGIAGAEGGRTFDRRWPAEVRWMEEQRRREWAADQVVATMKVLLRHGHFGGDPRDPRAAEHAVAGLMAEGLPRRKARQEWREKSDDILYFASASVGVSRDREIEVFRFDLRATVDRLIDEIIEAAGARHARQMVAEEEDEDFEEVEPSDPMDAQIEEIVWGRHGDSWPSEVRRLLRLLLLYLVEERMGASQQGEAGGID